MGCSYNGGPGRVNLVFKVCHSQPNLRDGSQGRVVGPLPVHVTRENGFPEDEAAKGANAAGYCGINGNVIAGGEDEYRRKVIASAGREMACAHSFHTGSGDPIQSHAFESEALCTRRDNSTCRRLGWNLLFPAR